MKTVMARLQAFAKARFRADALIFPVVWVFLVAASSAAERGKKPIPGSDIFDGTNIVRISISIPRAGLNKLQGYSWGNWGQEKPEARATVTEGTNTYKNVAVHLKGSAGSFRQLDDKPGLTLNFDKFESGQTFHGLQKISLNNSVQDPTFIEEKLCREMYEAAGVPVPRADYALVTLNGKDLGLYVLLEGYNKQFLRRYFKNVSGNLYDGGFCREITDDLNVNSGDKPNDKSDLERLASAAASARRNNSLDELSKILDIDRFLTMVALEVIQCHWDGYTMNRNNYRVYHDMDSGKMIFMPHGMDQMFGTGDGRGSPQSSILPPMNGFVSGAVLGTTEGRSRYYKRLADVRTNFFNVEAITNRVLQLQDRIGKYAFNAYSHRRSSAQRLCQNIVARAESIDQQLESIPQMATFTNGVLRLSGWQPRNSNGGGKFDVVKLKDERKLLHIIATDSQSSSFSWRTRVSLPGGQYRFEGYTRTRGVGNGASGAQLRISRGPSVPQLHGDSEWTMLNFEFEVMDPNREVELVCELKGNQGEAWFDTTSLKIRRVE